MAAALADFADAGVTDLIVGPFGVEREWARTLDVLAAVSGERAGAV